MQAVNISELRANLLHYLKQASEGEEILVTSRGEVVATISPPVDKRKKARLQLKQLAKSSSLGDVLSPVEQAWESEA